MKVEYSSFSKEIRMQGNLLDNLSRAEQYELVQDILRDWMQGPIPPVPELIRAMRALCEDFLRQTV